MLRHDRVRTGLGLLVGLSLSIALVAPGCLRTLDESLIGKNHQDAGTGGSAGASGGGGSAGASGAGGSAGAAGTDAGGGSAGMAGGGGTSGSAGMAGGGGTGGLPDGGLTPYDPVAHPVKKLADTFDTGILIAADNADVFHTKKGDTAGTIVSTPLDGSASTPVSSGLNRPMSMIAPIGTLFVYYVGGASGGGQLGRFLKNPSGANPEATIQTGLDGSAIEQGVAIAAGDDNHAYVVARGVAAGAPTVLRFSLAASETSAEVLYTTPTGNESGGDVTESNGCVYWISNGKIWEISSTSALARKDALATPVTDAVGLASDATNFYYTRSNGEVWQRKLSTACDGSGPPEKIIAGGYTNIGDVIAYAPSTVAWAVKGDPSKSFDGGGIFTTPVGGYAVTQIAPATDGIDQISDAGSDVAYVTTTGSIRKVPK